jgi:hypothetical protein
VGRDGEDLFGHVDGGNHFVDRIAARRSITYDETAPG